MAGKSTIMEAVNQAVKTDRRVVPGGSYLPRMMGQLVKIGKLAPPWWSANRDRFLSQFWRDDGAFLSGIMFNASSKLSNIPIRIVAKNPAVASHVQQAEELQEIYTIASENGEGIHVTIQKWVQDWLGTDNGGFMEILGDGGRENPIKGIPYGVRHLDSLYCIRTGNPLYPVRVQERGGPYLLHWTRVVYAAQLPSTDRDMFGVGYSSVSRSIMIASDLMAMLNYKAEKMGSRPKSKLLVGKNIDGAEIMKAFAVADAIMNELGLQNFAKLVAIGGQDIEIDDIDLNSFDPFDEKVQTTLGLYALAFAWGLEANEVLPVTESKNAEEIAAQRARGKLPQVFVTTLESPLSFKLLPSHLKIQLDFPDDGRDFEVARINDIRARNAQRNITSGATTANVERRRLYDEGVINRDMFIEMQLEDGRLEDGNPVGSLFFNPGYNDLLLIPREYLVTVGSDSTAALREIQANKAAVYALMNTSSIAQSRKAREAFAALVWLEEQYDKQQATEIAQQPPIAPIGLERTPNEDGGLTSKSRSFFPRRHPTSLSKVP